MNVELTYILILLISGGCFALGGTEISDKIKGQKWIRRFALPIFLGLIVYLAFHVELWRVICFAIGSMVTFSLGYGDKNDWFKFNGISHPPKWFIGLVLPLPIIFIGWSWLILAYPIAFLCWFKVAQWTQWKLFEFFAGAMFGACLVDALLHMWK